MCSSSTQLHSIRLHSWQFVCCCRQLTSKIQFSSLFSVRLTFFPISPTIICCCCCYCGCTYYLYIYMWHLICLSALSLAFLYETWFFFTLFLAQFYWFSRTRIIRLCVFCAKMKNHNNVTLHTQRTHRAAWFRCVRFSFSVCKIVAIILVLNWILNQAVFVKF